jgi:hypothetical protein
MCVLQKVIDEKSFATAARVLDMSPAGEGRPVGRGRLTPVAVFD